MSFMQASNEGKSCGHDSSEQTTELQQMGLVSCLSHFSMIPGKLTSTAEGLQGHFP